MAELKNKPLSEWTLEEVVKNCKKINCESCKSCPFCNNKVEYGCMLYSYPFCWDLPKNPRLTESELAICEAVGAKWVSKNPHENYVRLWEDRPVYTDDEYKGERLLGFFTEERFPSIRPGDLVCVEDKNA